MSEYQYYEFQAVDRPLTPQEMAELRSLSTRARITPTQLQNVYHWGDFRGQPLTLLERYFDAFVYVANWGTQRFMVRLPRDILDPETMRPYAFAESLTIHTKGDWVILEFVSNDEEGMGWIADEDAEAWMPALLPLRAELCQGDARALYLGWLADVAAGFLDDEEREPPLPPGLGRLTASLATLAKLLRIDDDLLAAAAAASPDLPPEPAADDLRQRIADLPPVEKDDLLFQLADDPARARAGLLRRLRPAAMSSTRPSANARTAGMLRAAATERGGMRRQHEAARQAAEQARRERAAAAARERRLDSLVGQEEDLWRQVDALIAKTQPRAYDEAVQLLVDLRDLGYRQDDGASAFAARLRPLRERYMKRRALLERLDRAGLGA